MDENDFRGGKTAEVDKKSFCNRKIFFVRSLFFYVCIVCECMRINRAELMRGESRIIIIITYTCLRCKAAGKRAWMMTIVSCVRVCVYVLAAWGNRMKERQKLFFPRPSNHSILFLDFFFAVAVAASGACHSFSAKSHNQSKCMGWLMWSDSVFPILLIKIMLCHWLCAIWRIIKDQNATLLFLY